MAAPATTATAAVPVELDLDARLAVVGAAMTARLDQAAIEFGVNTAHLATEEPDLDTVVTQPITAPTPELDPYPTPIAALLHRARARIEAGWCTGVLRDEDGAACLVGAIRAEAPTRGAADDACVLLLEAIRRDFPHAQTLPSWNDAQRDPHLPARYLDRAASVAHARML